MSAIAISSLVYRYPQGGFVLSCPKLKFPAGKATLITGPNGSGKTTLAKLMCGVLRPGEGEVHIFGQPVNGWPLGKIGKMVGYLFQDPSRQLFAPRVWDEMTFVDDIFGLKDETTVQKAGELLDYFALTPLAGRSTYHLSRGEKQRLALCTILMGGAEFLILDEPTTALDYQNRLKLYALLDGLLARGKGLAIISHEEELIRRYGENTVRLEQGRVLL